MHSPKEHQTHEELEQQKVKLKAELDKLRLEKQKLEKYIENQKLEEGKLKRIVAEADDERARQKKELDGVLTLVMFCFLCISFSISCYLAFSNQKKCARQGTRLTGQPVGAAQ